MRRPTKPKTRKMTGDSQDVTELARHAVIAGSRLERLQWEQLLDTKISNMLRHHQQAAIDGILENLFEPDPDAYDLLLDCIESNSESVLTEGAEATIQTLLIAIPILAWTRFSIPSGKISSSVRDQLNEIMSDHVLAPGVRLLLSPQLLAIDQLPQNHVETFQATQTLQKATLTRRDAPASKTTPETIPFLADTRYLIGAVVADPDSPIFIWQTEHSKVAQREDVLKQWQTLAGPILHSIMPGCGLELLLPQAYFSACREADQAIRPASIRAAVHYLVHTLDVPADELTVAIGMFGEAGTQRVDEFRLGFSLNKSRDVVYGVVWPLYGEEDALQDGPRLALLHQLQLAAASAMPDESSLIADLSDASLAPLLPPLTQILGLLRDEGVSSVIQHEEMFPMEFCEDCGAPLYPDTAGDLVHPEMPDEVADAPAHFH